MIFITGATGFVGGHLLVQLLKKGKKVRALKRLSSNYGELIIICKHYEVSPDWVIESTEWVIGDILDKSSLESSLEDVSVIYHCAAVVSFDGNEAGALSRINIEGTKNLTELAIDKRVECFAFVSSIGALGQSHEGEIIDEDTPWDDTNNSSVYSHSKYAAEQEVWKAAARGLDVVVVNPGVILGAGDTKKGSLRLIGEVRKGMPFYTSQETGYVDVRDVCEAIRLLVDEKIYNQRFVLVSENLSNKVLFTLIAKAFGQRPPFIKVGRKSLEFARKLSGIFSRILGKNPFLTAEIVRSATKKEKYSSQKFIIRTGYTFMPIKTSIEQAINSCK